MVGLTRAGTGEDLGWLAVLGDARVLPEHRGLGWIDVALEKLAEVVPRSVTLGLFIIKEGNRAADHLRSRLRRASGRPPDGVEPACDAPEATRAGGRRHDGDPCGP